MNVIDILKEQINYNRNTNTVVSRSVADELVKILHTVQAQQADSNWVNVKDHLPKTKDKIAVLALCEHYGKRTIKTVWFYDDKDLRGFTATNVTHWQYLPSLPKGFGDD